MKEHDGVLVLSGHYKHKIGTVVEIRPEDVPLIMVEFGPYLRVQLDEYDLEVIEDA